MNNTIIVYNLNADNKAVNKETKKVLKAIKAAKYAIEGKTIKV